MGYHPRPVASASRTPSGTRSATGEGDERFRLLVESVTDYAIFILDPDGKIATWNVGAERIKGYRADEIIGKHFSIFYPPEDVAAGKTERELEIAIAHGALRGGGLAAPQGRHALLGQRHHHRAARPGTASSSASPRSPATSPSAAQAEEEAHRFRLLVESVKDYAIFILDPTGHVADLEPRRRAHQGIQGRKRSSASTSRSSIRPRTSPPASASCELEVAGREGRFEDEGWRVRKDGTRIWANVIITALRNPDGSLLGFAKVTRDLTERRRG